MPGVDVPPGFIRPDPEPQPDLPSLRKSAVGTLNDGKQLRYSTVADYVEHYVSLGIVRDSEDLVQNYGHLIPEIFFQWVTTGQLGCLFAVKLARKPRENRWLPIVQLDALSQPNLGEVLNAELDAATENHEAAVIIFPGVDSQEQIADLINALCSSPSGRWYWTTAGIEPHPDNAIQLVGLRWVLASGKSVNFVLGFSSLSTMPLTRQSPFTALFLRIGDEKRTPNHREDGKTQVHLADLDSTFYPQELHDLVVEKTKEYRAKRVEPHLLPVARARVTIAITAAAAASLCVPRNVVVEKEGDGLEYPVSTST
jgi:hypothetical protein